MIRAAAPMFTPRALIVDDAASARLTLQRLLSRDGIPSDGAATGTEALRLLTERRYDIVLLDVELGEDGENGFEVLAEIRRRPELVSMPVILVTATARSPAAVARALTAGANDHVRKPFDPVELRARVTAARRVGQTFVRLVDAANKHEGATRELEEAGELQRASLPPVPLRHSGIDVVGAVLPASELSGDAFDVVHDTRGRVSAALLDAAGHGAAAGLVLSATREALTRALRDGLSLDDVARAVERALGAIGAPLYTNVALGIARADASSGTVELLNAGLPPILVTRSWGAERQQFRSTTLPLGMMPARRIEVVTTSLERRGMVAIASDGVTGGMPVAEPLEELLGKALAAQPWHEGGVQRLAETLAHAVGDPPDDDATLVLLRSADSGC
jgi:CheY-like chemotaxis protein